MTKYILIVISLFASFAVPAFDCKVDSECTAVERSCLVFGINKKEAVQFAKSTTPVPNICLTNNRYNSQRVCYKPKCNLFKCTVVEKECFAGKSHESLNIGSSLFFSPECNIPGYVFSEELLNSEDLNEENSHLDLILKYLKRVARSDDWQTESQNLKCVIPNVLNRNNNSQLSEYFHSKIKETADTIVDSKNKNFLKLIEELEEKYPGSAQLLADGNFNIIATFSEANKLRFLINCIYRNRNLEMALKDLFSLPPELLKKDWDSLKETLGSRLSTPINRKWLLKGIYSNQYKNLPGDLNIYLDPTDQKTNKEVLKFLANNQHSPWACTLAKAASQIFNGKDNAELYLPFANSEVQCVKMHLGLIGQRAWTSNDNCQQKLNSLGNFFKEFPNSESWKAESFLGKCATYCEKNSDCINLNCSIMKPRNIALKEIYANICKTSSKSALRSPSNIQCLNNQCAETGLKPKDCSASSVYTNIKNEIKKLDGLNCKTDNDCILSNPHAIRFFLNEQFANNYNLQIIDDYVFRCENSELRNLPSDLFTKDELIPRCEHGQCSNNLDVDAKIKKYHSFQSECEKEIPVEKKGYFINACKLAKTNNIRIEKADYLVADFMRSCGGHAYLDGKTSMTKPPQDLMDCTLKKYQQSHHFKVNK